MVGAVSSWRSPENAIKQYSRRPLPVRSTEELLAGALYCDAATLWLEEKANIK